MNINQEQKAAEQRAGAVAPQTKSVKREIVRWALAPFPLALATQVSVHVSVISLSSVKLKSCYLNSVHVDRMMETLCACNSSQIVVLNNRVRSMLIREGNCSENSVTNAVSLNM